jgi:hypothetical protein
VTSSASALSRVRSGAAALLPGDGLTFTACRVDRAPLRSAACDLQFFPAIYGGVL